MTDTALVSARGVSNVLKAVGGRLATQVILLASAFLIPRAMGPHDYGVYAAVVAALGVVQSLIMLGLPLVEVRSLAPLWSQGRLDEAIGLGSTIWSAKLLLSTAGAALLTTWLAFSPGLVSGAFYLFAVGLLGLTRFTFEGTKNLLIAFDRVGRMSALEAARSLVTLVVVLALYLSTADLGSVFFGLSVTHGLLFLLAALALLSALPLRPGSSRWELLAPHVGFGISSHLGAVARVLQTQLVVYLVVVTIEPRIGGFVGLVIQVFTVVQTLFLTVRRALMPVLADLVSAGDRQSLGASAELLARYSAALLCIGMWFWALGGKWMIRALISEAFLPVYRPILAVLLAAALLTWAETCNGILLLEGRGLTVSSTLVLHAALTLAGLAIVSRWGGEQVPMNVAWVLVLASACFCLTAFIALRRIGGVRLPMARSLFLLLPALPSFFLLEAPLAPAERIGVGLGFLVVYAACTVPTGLIPVSELRRVIPHRVRPQRARRPSNPPSD